MQRSCPTHLAGAARSETPHQQNQSPYGTAPALANMTIPDHTATTPSSNRQKSLSRTQRRHSCGVNSCNRPPSSLSASPLPAGEGGGGRHCCLVALDAASYQLLAHSKKRYHHADSIPVKNGAITPIRWRAVEGMIGRWHIAEMRLGTVRSFVGASRVPATMISSAKTTLSILW